jgi:hypothetical protein
VISEVTESLMRDIRGVVQQAEGGVAEIFAALLPSNNCASARSRAIPLADLRSDELDAALGARNCGRLDDSKSGCHPGCYVFRRLRHCRTHSVNF